MKSLQLDKPHAIVMVGIAGSGKTFFAKKFSEMFSAPYIDQSIIRQYAYDEKAAAELFSMQLEELLKTKKSIILEVDSNTRNARNDLARVLKKSGFTPLFVWVQTDPETAQIRSTKNRSLTRDEHDDQVKRFAPPVAKEDALVISGKHTYATQARIVLKKLSTPRAEVPIQPEQRTTRQARNPIFIR